MVRFTFRAPENLIEQIREQAHLERRSVNSQIVHMLENAIDSEWREDANIASSARTDHEESHGRNVTGSNASNRVG